MRRREKTQQQKQLHFVSLFCFFPFFLLLNPSIAAESHNLRTTGKGSDASQTEACAVVAMRARRCVLLTGTPSLAKPHDLFRQVCRGVKAAENVWREGVLRSGFCIV